MIVVMERTATEGEIADVVEHLTARGAAVQRMDGEHVTLAAGGTPPDQSLATLSGVASVLSDVGALPMVGRDGVGSEATTSPGASAGEPPPRRGPADRPGFAVGDRWIGGGEIFVAAGPCSVEDPDTMERVAAAVAAAGATALRAGAYKPRSSPYSFQGMGEEGLALARKAADAHGLLFVSEVLDATHIPLASRYVDILQVGARNMANTSLLRELGRARKPVLLKRGLAATIDEWLNAAEYVISAGNPRVILCERGIRTFETATRNTLDLNAVPVVRERSRLPVIVDPSHGTGKRAYVRTMARAAMATGADGLIIEVHPDPDRATSDAAQTVDPDTFAAIMRDAGALRALLAPGVS
jgi:3-deoxy-7-phosphoheptulonate synthase